MYGFFYITIFNTYNNQMLELSYQSLVANNIIKNNINDLLILLWCII